MSIAKAVDKIEDRADIARQIQSEGSYTISKARPNIRRKVETDSCIERTKRAETIDIARDIPGGGERSLKASTAALHES